jgi:hypothetical protein
MRIMQKIRCPVELKYSATLAGIETPEGTSPKSKAGAAT